MSEQTPSGAEPAVNEAEDPNQDAVNTEESPEAAEARMRAEKAERDAFMPQPFTFSPDHGADQLGFILERDGDGIIDAVQLQPRTAYKRALKAGDRITIIPLCGRDRAVFEHCKNAADDNRKADTGGDES